MTTRQTPVANAPVSNFPATRRAQPDGRNSIAAWKKLNVHGSVRVLSQGTARVALVAALLLSALDPFSSKANLASPLPVDLVQPDGSKITLHIRGDEYFHWFEDLQGFTVVLEQSTYVYATLNSQGLLAPTGLVVGQTDPDAAGLKKGLLPSAQVRDQLRAQALPPSREVPRDIGKRIAPQGSVKNLVILCKFSDHVFGTHTRDRADYDVICNAVGGHPVLAPTGSVKDFYQETSYGKMTLNSTVIAWVTLPHNEAYYGNGSDGLQGAFPNNSQGMVRDALDLADPLVNFGDYDTDNDGYVDAIDIIHSGYAAETGGGGKNWMWSHRWSLYQVPGGRWTSADRNGNGANVKVYDYHTEAALWATSGTEIVRIGVICHETGHFFGLPDLYDSDHSSDGIGSYCLMANSWGFDFTQFHPPHFSAWCKMQLGWVIPTVISPGNYSAPQVETSPTVFRINAGYPSGEYLLIENRQRVGFENNMPQAGLALWHIDESKPDNKQEGYPGQAGWPDNNNHYKIALLQADGLYNLEHHANRGDGGDVYHGNGVSAIGADTVPNTHAYQNGNILVTSNRISAISAAGANMTFTYSRATAAAPSISSFNPTSGPVGTNVVIAGANFTGATAVRFNGVSATFAANTAVQITATVPAGATTGPISVTTAGGTATSATSFTVIASPPANDNFANGQLLSGGAGKVNGNNTSATKEAGEANHAGNGGGKSIWYYWTAPTSGPVTMDTFGSSFNTLLGVYTGNAVGALSLVASNDDTATNTQSQVGFTTVAGTVYRIAVDGFNGVSGSVVVNWFLSGGGNDNFANGQVISGSAGIANGNNAAATKEPGEPNHANNVGGKSIWYYWTAPGSGQATVDTANSGFDTLLGVYTGSSVGALSLIASNDDIFGGVTTQSQVNIPVSAGTTYRIAIDGYNGASGSVVLNWALSSNAPSISGFVPTTGQAGTNVVISGTNFTGATAVRFNGTSASFTVKNATQITATVPAGAITGPISVTTPGGTAISAANFTVTSGFNDNFANAQAISGSFGSFNGSNVGATREAGEPNHAGNAGPRSIWYSWTAPGSGPVSFDTIGSDFDTLLGVYTGSSVGALSLVVSNDDIVPGTNQQSLVSFPAVAGTIYRIALDGFDGAFGKAVLNWTVRPAHDNFADGLVVGGSAGSVTRSSVGATKEPGEPNHAGNAGGRSVWYYWTAPSSGVAIIDTGGSSFDTILGVYTGTGVGALALVANNDDYGQLTSLVSFPVSAGTIYRIAVDGFNGAAGNVVLNWSLVLNNDNFANGHVITGMVGTVTGNNAGATKEAGEPDHASNAGGRSIWYYWTAPNNGLFTIDTVGSSFDTLLGSYTGNSVGALTPIASNDDIIPGINRWSRAKISAVAGTVYRIAVDGYGGDFGTVVLNWAPTPANDNFANGQAINGSVGSVNGSSLGATKETNEPDHAANRGGNSIWYHWTAPSSAPVTIDTQGSGFDTLLAVYTGGSVGALTPIASSDDTTTNVQSRVSFSAAAGTTYRIAVDGYSGVSGGVVLAWAVAGAVDAPSLSSALYANQIVLAWPTRFTGFGLESTLSLTSGAPWSAVSPAPVIVDGSYTVTNTTTGGSKFYRLRKP